MKDFRRGDVVLIAGIVVDGDDDTIRVTINGTEAVVSIGEATISRRSFHPGDHVTSSHENARIIQTIEPGIHLVHFEGRTGAAAYQVTDESGLAHRDAPEKAEDRQASAAGKGQQESSGSEAKPEGETKGETPAGAAPSPRFVFERPGAAPTFTDRAEGAAHEQAGEGSESTFELGGHEAPRAPEASGERDRAGLADDLASSLDGRSGAVDIDLEQIGVTEDFRPLGERGTTEA